MARRKRQVPGGMVFHVLNRGVGRNTIFHKEEDYAAFDRVLAEAHQRVPIRIVAHCLMPNHWHFVLWPKERGDVGLYAVADTHTHTQRWHAHYHTSGTGHLYQGRFKSFPVQRGLHLLLVLRYVERNALRAGCSLNRRAQADRPAWLVPLSEWPVSQTPRDWIERVEPENELELVALRRSVNRGQPYGEMEWQAATAKALSLESSLRNPGGRRRR